MSSDKINEYDLRLNSNFISDYEDFRKTTSKEFQYKAEYYRSVYLDSSHFAELNVSCGDAGITLLVNLEFYYVYGFKIKDQYYSFNGEATDSLRKAGFQIPQNNIIPYGDAYYEIGTKEDIQKVSEQKVTIELIGNSISSVSDLGINWESKREDILRVFWSLVEGIRFNKISDSVNQLIEGDDLDITYDFFYFMAERWAKLSVGTAFIEDTDSSIAVFELHRLGIPPGASEKE